MVMKDLLEILQMQEEILQFTHFTNSDAWELGNIIVAQGKKLGAEIAIRIRLNNGYTVFQCGFDGTNLLNEDSLRKKENTVRVSEHSSLHMWALVKETENAVEEELLDVTEYAICGGCFPIRVEEVGVIGTIAVSGIDHVSDHDLLIKCISRYLHVDEIPRIRAESF
jgi:uncharacterized protein (UPF0303 family)